tara:strand:+ start:217 stop:321 length:105 start_codon:yes stop_codon:yes gene_type:complete
MNAILTKTQSLMPDLIEPVFAAAFIIEKLSGIEK